MNWRKPIIYTLLYLSGSKIPQDLKEIRRIQRLNSNEIRDYQEQKLKKILIHAYKNVPYYNKVLKQAGVIETKDNKINVNLNNFNKIPILTKEIMRKEGKNLYSKDHKYRKPFENTSGGSTGEPVRFIQDKNFYEWMVATKLYYFHLAGKELGERELKLWGSERDILEGTIGIKEKIKNWLYNRKFLNSFKMTEENMKQYIKEINTFKPKVIWAYVESIYELAKFIEKNNINIYSPKGIISTAGNLTEEVKEKLENIFRCKVFNGYGTREVGDIASQKNPNQSLIIFDWFQYLEIINKDNQSNQNNPGKIIITNLENYSMPLIRYDIGDLGEIDKINKNKYSFNLLKKIIGREMESFKNKKGDIIPPEYFIHMVGVVFNDGSIKKFQVIQKQPNQILIKVIINNNAGNFNNTKSIIEKEVIKRVMGNDCKINWEIVEDIPKTPSGKYLYTISEVR